MSKKSDKKSTAIIIGSIVALVVILVVTIVVIVSKNKENELGDSFFQTTDKRIVYTLNYEDENNNANYGAKKVHQVYTNDGEIITSYSMYYEYKDEDRAAAALEKIQKDIKTETEIKEAKQERNYVVVVFNESSYKGSTNSDVRKWVDTMKRYDATHDSKVLEGQNNIVEDDGYIYEDDYNEEYFDNEEYLDEE